MKLGDFPIVEAMVSTRNHLIEQRDEGRLAIEINGHRLDAEAVEAVRPAVTAELNRRIRNIEEQLRQHGVAVD